MNFKIVVSDPKERKAYQKEVDQKASGLIGRKIGEVVPGDLLGLNGYKLEITGGSDKQGFPMRKDVEGTARKKILLSGPPGFHPERKGQRKRKSVRGNTISSEIVQVNMKVVEYGKKSLAELFGVKKEETEETKKEEAKPEKEVKEKSAEEKKTETEEEKQEKEVKEKPTEKEETKSEEVKQEAEEAKSDKEASEIKKEEQDKNRPEAKEEKQEPKKEEKKTNNQ